MKRNTQRLKWKKQFTAEKFSLFQEVKQKNLFEVSWKKCNGNYGRRRFSATCVEEALDQAPAIAGLVSFHQPVGNEDPTVLEAFDEALAHTKRGKRAKWDWEIQQIRFMVWLVDHYPDCSHWSMISRRIVREYMTMFNGRAPNTIRLALQPIIQTSGYMSREYSLPHVAERLGIGSKLAKTPPTVYLTDVVAFLDWVRDTHPLLEAGASLQGLVGLQLQEALRLTWDKVDLDQGLIEISGEVKNPYRSRVIPVCERVVEVLRRVNMNRHLKGVVPVKEHVVLSPMGCSFIDGNSFRNYSHRMKEAFREWNEQVEWTPKDLRNCILTYAVTEGFHSEVWEQYVGHSPRSITARHYIPRLASATFGEQEALKKQMASFKQLVVEPLNIAIGKLAKKDGAEILNFFEHQPAQEPANAEVL